jgi:hypothetical protein
LGRGCGQIVANAAQFFGAAGSASGQMTKTPVKLLAKKYFIGKNTI